MIKSGYKASNLLGLLLGNKRCEEKTGMYYGIHGKFSAAEGKREELLAILLQAAQALQSNPGCLLYLVSRAADDPDGIWVSEVWADAAAHQASLEPEEIRAIITQARPLIAGMSGRVELDVAGGKGLPTR
jgi:quinol monooxygenase YgiN